MFKFLNGDLVKDTVTGFKGMVVHRVDYLNGCLRYGVQPTKLKDGKPIEVEMFDEQQLELVESAPNKVLRRTGGDRKPPQPRKAIPRF